MEIETVIFLTASYWCQYSFSINLLCLLFRPVSLPLVQKLFTDYKIPVYLKSKQHLDHKDIHKHHLLHKDMLESDIFNTLLAICDTDHHRKTGVIFECKSD